MYGKRIMRPSDIQLERELEQGAAEIAPQSAKDLERVRQSSVYTFKRGLETLTTKLVEKLQSAPNVVLESKIELTSLRLQDAEGNARRPKVC